MNSLIPTDDTVIDCNIEYKVFPKADVIVALLDHAKYYEDEIETLLLKSNTSVDDWCVVGVGEQSPGSYYVMDMRKLFLHKTDRRLIPFADYNINTGEDAYYPVHIQDVKSVLLFNNEEYDNHVLCQSSLIYREERILL